jgi:acyl-coenzyme A thioesterase PaaI-like protein
VSALDPQPPAIQDFYSDDAAHCYGCGHRNERGHQFRTRATGDGTVTEFTPEPWMTALPGLVYGGLIASLLDCHSTGSAAVFALAREGVAIGAGVSPRFVTRHLAVDYLAPTRMGPLRALGRLVEATDRKVIVESTLEADGAVTAKARAVLIRLESAPGPT